MQRVKQTKMHIPGEQNGNCFAAVISSITDIPIEHLPLIEETFQRDDWNVSLFGWLMARHWIWRGAPEFKFLYGMGRMPEHITPDMVTDRPYLVTGKTERFEGQVNHVCIYMNGRLWHDPHPSDAGLTTLEEFEVIEPMYGKPDIRAAFAQGWDNSYRHHLNKPGNKSLSFDFKGYNDQKVIEKELKSRFL
jgi:hypothetical protein